MKVFHTIAKKIAYLLAIIIIIVATLTSISRLLTPLFDQHRANFEKWASALLGMPVNIEKVRVSWYQYQPEINLNGVTILNKTTNKPLLQIETIRIFFSIPESLWQRQFIPSGLMISGTDINLHQTITGRISVQGFPNLGGFNSNPYQQETGFIDMMSWLSVQPRLILQNINIRYTPLKSEKRFITLYQLNFQNNGLEHRIFGKAILHQDIPTEMTLAIQWQGKQPDLSQIKAKGYLYLSGFSIAQWLKNYTWNAWQTKHGIVSAKVWVTWDRGAFQKIQSMFQLYDLHLYSTINQSEQIIHRLSGDIGWRREGENQIIVGDNLLIDLPTHLWPATHFYVSFVSNADHQFLPKIINIGYLDMKDMQSFLLLSSLTLSNYMKEFLLATKPNGYLQNTAIRFGNNGTDWHHLTLKSTFSNFNLYPWQHFPGISNLSGDISWDGTIGNISFRSYHSLFQYRTIFANPIVMNQLTGKISLQPEKNNGWLLNIISLNALNNDLAINVDGKLLFSTGRLPEADLQAHFSMKKASHVTRYLPLKVFDAELVKWLQGAFLNGEVKSGNAILQGPLAHYPFDHGEGKFSINAQINNIDFHYAPNWPKLEQVNGSLLFSGRQMLIEVTEAKLLNIPIKNIHGIIPYLGDAKPQILEINSGEILSDFMDGLRFIHQSPLEKTVGKMFSVLDIHGPMVLSLGLMIPLKHPDNTKVQGNITLKNAILNLLPWHLSADQLNGALHFTEKSIEADNIQGKLFNKPLQFKLSTIQKTKAVSIVRANFSTKLNLIDLETWLKVPTSPLIQGETSVTGSIDFSLKTPVNVHLKTNLQGVTVNLPAEYAKKSQELRAFSADLLIEEKKPLYAKITYGDLFKIALKLEMKGEKFDIAGINLSLGNEEVKWPVSSGLFVTGYVDQLDWDKIKIYMSQSTHTGFSSLLLQSVNIRTKILTVLGQNLTQVILQVVPSKKGWNINISSKEVIGHIQFPAIFKPQEFILAEFQKINLQSIANVKQSSFTLPIQTLPAISFIANDVSYNHLPIGKVNFKTMSDKNGLHIQGLQASSLYMNLQATGAWIQKNNRYSTRLQGTIISSNVSELLNSMGLGVNNFISSHGKLTFNLEWRNAPYLPELRTMNGNANFDLGPGRIVDVGQTSGAKMDIGKMLSIFSLQTIPRRLSFDFSDVFQKGYSFDFFRGNFMLKEGNAYTNNTHFNGPVARVDIYGRIGLVNKDYDFTLSVTPYVTSSLPLAATIINPSIGLAAFAANMLIGPAVSKATTYYYAVRGPWSHPSWTSVSVNKNNK